MTQTPPPPAPQPRSSRLGNLLFVIYFVIYAGFVGIAAFSGSCLTIKPFGGLNLAIIYGFALITFPLILSLIYLMWASKAKD